jgi:hypothetical protein
MLYIITEKQPLYARIRLSAKGNRLRMQCNAKGNRLRMQRNAKGNRLRMQRTAKGNRLRMQRNERECQNTRIITLLFDS